MKLDRFFKDKESNWVLYQHPNLLLWLWLVCQAASLFIFKREQPALSTLSNLLLFAWAYQEVRYGNSPFRRVLGAAILAFVVVGLFV